MVIRHSRIPRVAALLATLLCGALPAAEEAPSYALGHGLRLPALDLTLAGYTSLRARGLEGRDTRFDLHDLALFVIWAPAPRWTLFTEIEGEELATLDDRGLNNSDAEIVVERLYVDYAATPTLSLRGGRFLTPFGRWNLLHADPLVWTVTRPLVTVIAIPDHATGVMVHGRRPLAAGSLEYSGWGDASADLDPAQGEADFEEFDLPGLQNDFDHAGGAQLRYRPDHGRAGIGASWASFDVDGGRGHHHAFGVDGLYNVQRWELSTELAYRVNTASGEDEDWGGFVQVVAPLAGPLYAVSRVEYYASGVLDDEGARASIGLALRPVPPFTCKVEYHDGNNRQLLPDGWEMSCGILF